MITAVIYGNLARGRGGPANCFLKNPSIRRVLVLDPGNGLSLPSGCEAFRCDGPVSGRTWNTLLSDVSTRYILYLFRADIRIDPHAPERLIAAAAATRAGMVYADYAEPIGKSLREHPLNDYQTGSIRDRFDFGPMILISTAAARRALRKYGEIPPFRWAGWYDLQLKISTDRRLFHLPERLSVVKKSSEKQDAMQVHSRARERHFDYVDPRNRLFQQEMEEAATLHLKRIGAWLRPSFRNVPVSDRIFPV